MEEPPPELTDTAVEEGVRTWLEAAEVTAEGRPTEGGYSNVTVFLRVDGTSSVLRLAPSRAGLMPSYDLGRQVVCMQHAMQYGLPVPSIQATDLEGTVFGRPAFVMERMPGRVPSDGEPNFVRRGFLHDASPAHQRTYMEDLIRRLGQLHRVPALPEVELPGANPKAHVRWCEATAQMWGRDDPWFTTTAAALEASAPARSAHVSLLWGDARPANTVVGPDFDVVAMLDWEMAAKGAGEVDVAWLLEMNRMRAGGDIRRWLPGFPAEGQVWRLWEQEVGRDARDVQWYRLLAAFRTTVLLESHLHVLAAREGFPAAHPLWEDNRARRRTEQLLEDGG